MTDYVYSFIKKFGIENLDKNNDGTIIKAEFREALKNGNENTSNYGYKKWSGETNANLNDLVDQYWSTFDNMTDGKIKGARKNDLNALNETEYKELLEMLESVEEIDRPCDIEYSTQSKEDLDKYAKDFINAYFSNQYKNYDWTKDKILKNIINSNIQAHLLEPLTEDEQKRLLEADIQRYFATANFYKSDETKYKNQINNIENYNSNILNPLQKTILKDKLDNALNTDLKFFEDFESAFENATYQFLNSEFDNIGNTDNFNILSNDIVNKFRVSNSYKILIDSILSNAKWTGVESSYSITGDGQVTLEPRATINNKEITSIDGKSISFNLISEDSKAQVSGFNIKFADEEIPSITCTLQVKLGKEIVQEKVITIYNKTMNKEASSLSINWSSSNNAQIFSLNEASNPTKYYNQSGKFVSNSAKTNEIYNNGYNIICYSQNYDILSGYTSANVNDAVWNECRTNAKTQISMFVDTLKSVAKSQGGYLPAILNAAENTISIYNSAIDATGSRLDANKRALDTISVKDGYGKDFTYSRTSADNGNSWDDYKLQNKFHADTSLGLEFQEDYFDNPHEFQVVIDAKKLMDVFNYYYQKAYNEI